MIMVRVHSHGDSLLGYVYVLLRLVNELMVDNRSAITSGWFIVSVELC